MMIGGAMAAAFTGLAPMVANANIVTSNYASSTLTIGLFSGDISKLAVNKAVHPMVQHFARLEQEETSAVGGLLLGAGAAKPDRPETLADTLKKLKAMDPGTKFDRLYLRSEIDGHEELLKIQKQRVKEGKAGMDTTIATILVPFIESHLVMLHAARNSMAT
nr:DUF4142 domain-containing protein [Marinicella sp. W31]MDC2877871.1 DUF4142 domain-containing protein [Marinicella sp. W31]